MAVADAHPEPIFEANYRLVFPILNDSGQLVSGAAGLSVQLRDQAGAVAATNLPVEVPTNTGMYYLDLTWAEMTCFYLTGVVKSTTTGARPTPFVLNVLRLPALTAATIQSATSDKAVLSASEPALENFYLGCKFYVVSDTPAGSRGQAIDIIYYVGATREVHLGAHFATIPTAGSTYRILQTRDAMLLGRDMLTNSVPGSYAAGTAGQVLGSLNGRVPTALVGGKIDSVADMVAISGDTTAADALEATLDGTGAALRLTTLTVTAGATITQSTANSPGITVTGNGTGAGINATGGVSGGQGIRSQGGGGNGAGLEVTGTGAGSGLKATGGSTNGSGIEGIAGLGTGAGLKGTAGTTGVGMRLTGGTTSGDGMVVTATSGAEIRAHLTGNLSGTIGGLTAAALADFFDTNSGSTYAAAVAGSVVKEIASNASGGGGADPWLTLLPGAYGAGTAGNILGNRLDVAVSSRMATFTYTVPPTVGAIADAVWDEALAGHLTAGSTGAALNAAGSAGDPWTTVLPGAYTGSQAGAILGSRLDVAVSTRLATAGYTAPPSVATIQAGLATAAALSGVQTDVDLLQLDVDDLQTRLPAALVGGRMDAHVGTVAVGALTAEAFADSAVDEIVGAVWDENLGAHLNPDSTGEALAAAALGGGGGGGDDPWATLLPGGYAPGTAGQILGTRLDATVSSRASAAAVSAIQTDVDQLQTDVATLTSDVGEVHVAVSAVNADTDNIQARLPAALVGGKMDSTVGPVTLAPGQETGLSPAAIDAILDEVIEGPFTLRQILRLLFASQAGKTNGALGPQFHIRDVMDTKNRIAASVDAEGNRLAVVLDGS